MQVRIERHIEIPQSYRVARACGLFNVDLSLGQDFMIEAELPVDRDDWSIGVIAGPSGSGKSTLAAALSERGYTDWEAVPWPTAPIIDAIAGESFDDVTAALASVGLGSVPSWLRPYGVLSNGERFRAGLARLIAERPARVYVDEYSSVVDRRVAEIGSGAFAKAWRRGNSGQQVVLLTPHFDVLPWIKPDWVLRTSLTGPTVTTADVESMHPEVDRADYADAPVVGEVVA